MAKYFPLPSGGEVRPGTKRTHLVFKRFTRQERQQMKIHAVLKRMAFAECKDRRKNSMLANQPMCGGCLRVDGPQR